MSAQEAARGTRVRLVHLTDAGSHLRPGAEGTVLRNRLDAEAGTLSVRWDDGTCLGLVPDEGDDFEVLA